MGVPLNHPSTNHGGLGIPNDLRTPQIIQPTSQISRLVALANYHAYV